MPLDRLICKCFPSVVCLLWANIYLLLLVQEDERAAQRRAAKAAALAEFTAEPPDALPPTGPSARRDPTMQERGPPPGTPPAAVVPSVPPSGPVWGSPSGTGAAADWPPATEAMTPERPPPQPMQPPPAPARPPRPPRPPPPDENGSGLDASDVEVCDISCLLSTTLCRMDGAALSRDKQSSGRCLWAAL